MLGKLRNKDVYKQGFKNQIDTTLDSMQENVSIPDVSQLTTEDAKVTRIFDDRAKEKATEGKRKIPKRKKNFISYKRQISNITTTTC